MTAEFDNSGFSAVDKFFGGNRAAEEALATPRKPTGSSASRSRQRGGVGAAPSKASGTAASSEALAKQVLNVGRKRSRDNDHDEEEENAGNLGVDNHGIDGGDEEDGGRTAIVKKKKNKNRDGDDNTKAKKKLGKKERQRLKEMAAKASGASNDAEPAIETFEPVSGVPAAATEDSASGATSGEPAAKPKKKRKKVRSRQKNIRKDHRSAEEKPAHLIPGSAGYRGRPMTQETREKLNLPPPNRNPKMRRPRNNNGTRFPETNEGKNDGDASSPLFVIDRTPEGGGGDDLGVKLAIDEFMSTGDKGTADPSGASGAALPHKDDGHPKAKKKASSKPSKKKKKRFKNL